MKLTKFIKLIVPIIKIITSIFTFVMSLGSCILLFRNGFNTNSIVYFGNIKLDPNSIPTYHLDSDETFKYIESNDNTAIITAEISNKTDGNINVDSIDIIIIKRESIKKQVRFANNVGGYLEAMNSFGCIFNDIEKPCIAPYLGEKEAFYAERDDLTENRLSNAIKMAKNLNKPFEIDPNRNERVRIYFRMPESGIYEIRFIMRYTHDGKQGSRKSKPLKFAYILSSDRTIINDFQNEISGNNCTEVNRYLNKIKPYSCTNCCKPVH